MPRCQQVAPGLWATGPVALWDRNAALATTAGWLTSCVTMAPPLHWEGIDSPMTACPPRSARSTGCEWLTPAAEMSGLASGNWWLSPHAARMGWTRSPHVATCVHDVDARSVRAARDFTIAALQRWNMTERSHDIAIVVSELMTNALRHARPHSGDIRRGWLIRLGLLQCGPQVLCAVADPSDLAPVPNAPDALDETGHGLQIICALSDKWGYTTASGGGKVVWALFSTWLHHICWPSLPTS